MIKKLFKSLSKWIKKVIDEDRKSESRLYALSKEYPTDSTLENPFTKQKPEQL